MVAGMVKAGSSRTKGARTSKCLSWSNADQAALYRLRARLAAEFGVILSERDVVAAAIRAALANPRALAPPRPAA
jgi:hypothetical protein